MAGYFFILWTVLLATSGAAAEGTPIDCHKPYTDYYVSYEENSRCEGRLYYASNLAKDGCIPPELFQTEQTSCLVVDADTTFCPKKVDISNLHYNVSLLVHSNDIEIDCNNRVIDHGFYNLGTRPDQFKCAGGINFHRDMNTCRSPQVLAYDAIRFPRDRSLQNVKIKNCHIRNTGYQGINIMRHFRYGQSGNTPDLVGHENIELTNFRLERTKLGIYVGENSQNITIKNGVIDYSHQIGIYLEANSQHSQVSQVSISHTKEREALAVDSTRNNIIQHSKFVGNKNGSIKVYKNCGELEGIVCPIKRQPPSDNIFRYNTIADPVSIASRQGKYHRPGFCLDLVGKQTHLFSNKYNGYNEGPYLDQSSRNILHDNTFVSCENHALELQYGSNQILDNRFQRGELCSTAAMPPAVRVSLGRWVTNQSLQRYVDLEDGLQNRNNLIFRNTFQAHSHEFDPIASSPEDSLFEDRIDYFQIDNTWQNGVCLSDNKCPKNNMDKVAKTLPAIL